MSKKYLKEVQRGVSDFLWKHFAFDIWEKPGIIYWMEDPLAHRKIKRYKITIREIKRVRL
jgi:hypothetical protein